jgi:hypothetical protein
MPPIAMSTVTLPKTLLPYSFFSAFSSPYGRQWPLQELLQRSNVISDSNGKRLACAAGILLANAALRSSPATAEK